ncbi:hypothetical protein GGI12_003063 [Dipsacomyces acuminosporus]|nr:hypothetical protein GGI12_003063 [Dipsacomyces acuminosporus]
MNSATDSRQHGQQQPTLEQLDAWCEQALSSPTAEVREEAERRLRYFFPTFAESLAEISGSLGFSSGQERVLTVFPSIKGPADAANLMLWFLHQSSKVFSITYIVRRLRALILHHLNVIPNDQKTDLRNGLFSAIQEKFAEMPAFLIDDATRTLALVIMFTWFDLSDSKDVIDTVLESGKTSAKHQILALRMLRAFVEEFNKELPPKYISKQRRVVVTFRDKQLKSIFEHSLTAMRDAIAKLSASENTVETRMVLSSALLLQRDCLAFDFIGLAPDDASDDAVAIQIPSSWKDLIQVDDFLDPYFDGYKHCEPPISGQFVEVLVMIASLRRSFYMETVRIAFVKRMSAGIVEILTNAIGLDDVENYHHLCRLLARFRCIHTLVEIEESPVYRELLSAAASFTMTGLTLWEWSANSIAPLLTFWAKVAATHDSQENDNTKIAGDLIAQTLPQVIKGYLHAMILATSRVVSGESVADDPLDNVDVLVENMTLVANIARTSYETCAPVVTDLLRGMAGKYQSLLNSGQANEELIAATESQLTWAVYAVALCIGGRQPYKSMPEDDRTDAELFATGLELDRLVQQRIQSSIAAPVCEALELAFIQMYYCFRSSYIGEQGYKVTAVFSKLSQYVGLNDTTSVLELILQKVLFNFKTWQSQSPVIQRSLQLFHDMSVGYVSVRQVAKLDTIKFLLANHSNGQFRFLSSIDDFKQRSQYYSALARILFAGDVTAAQFAEFTRPWSRMIEELLAMPDAQFAQDSVRPGLIRLLRDLRGFLTAISSKTAYTMFFNWLCPTRIQLIHRSIQRTANTQTQIAALKFMSELVYNRTQRLNFDVSSPNGILIFREASKAMWEYGSQILKGTQAPVRDIYKDRYKGVSVCFDTLMRLISGKYVAIGVMPLYGDMALDNAYSIVLELLKQFPVSDVIAYPKLGKSTLAMLEVLLAKKNIGLVNLDSAAYEQIMRLCVQAFDHAIVSVSSAACGVIDGVFTAAIEGAAAGTGDHDSTPSSASIANLAKLVHGRVDINQFLLKAILNIVLFEDRSNDWSFSRPLFCLIVLQSDFALQYTSQIVQYQAAERRNDLIKALKELLSSTDFTLTESNRDAFTQALTHYRREVTAKNLILMVPTDQTLGAPVQILSDTSGSADADGRGHGSAEQAMAE